MRSAGHFRSLARRPVSLSATLLASDESWIEDASVLDIGLGGASLLVRRPVEVRDSVYLEIESPNLWDPLVIPGTIQWVGQPDERGVLRIGLKFVPASGWQVRAMVDLVASTAYD